MSITNSARERLTALLVVTGTLLPAAGQADDNEIKGTPYDDEATFLLSEVDPVQNAAVDAAAAAIG